MIMEINIIVISVFLLSVLTVSMDIFISDGFKSNKFVIGLVTFLSTIIILILAISLNRKPKAIDVYRGKTTLEITYKDEVPIDSVVVWK